MRQRSTANTIVGFGFDPRSNVIFNLPSRFLPLRAGGDDFYKFFLGPSMVYTSGIITDLDRAETLEELQDNKLAVVCEKLDLQPSDRLLDIGCGWGTLAAFAHKNYKCTVLGITLSHNQTVFGNQRIRKCGGDPSRARIEYCDYRDLPREKGIFTKIVSLEMAEVRHFLVISLHPSRSLH
jgi:cyclopropane fatty-acyl-phospholipid synthase-like methyltransferase